MKICLALAFVVAVLPARVAADDRPEPTTTTLTGTCQKLAIGEKDMTDRCRGAIVRSTYPNAKSSFMFVVANTAVISFFGDDAGAAGDSATLAVRKVGVVLVGGKDKPALASATGACTYTNSNAGPSRVDCTARAAGRDFVASFVSDGTPPSPMPPPKE